MAPNMRKANTTGDIRLTPFWSILTVMDLEARVTKAPKRASDTSAAEPMAKPLPMAAVVLPAASSASVLSRTDEGSSTISAMPPALSEMGP